MKFRIDEFPLITLVTSQSIQRLITTVIINELSKEIKDLNQLLLYNQQKTQGLKKLTASLFKKLENKRKFISREIHDGPLQLSLDLSRWLKYLVEECNNNKKVKVIYHMQKIVENLNIELRSLCNDLRPSYLTDLGLLPAIELLCQDIMQKEILTISLEEVGINREERFNEDVEVTAYRFLQEAINNAVKHSDSNNLKIYIKKNELSIELVVKDLGKGFDTSKIADWSLTSDHFGLVGMKERLNNLGGVLQIKSSIGKGTILKAVIPIGEI